MRAALTRMLLPSPGAAVNFEQWMKEVNDLCLAQYCLSIHDLPDMLFRDAYDDGQTPEEFMSENLGDMEQLAYLILG